jgi:predicted amidohydrolase
MHKYTGDSMIVDPRGQVLAHAGPEPGTISADWNLDYLLEYRRTFPFLDDMLPSA